MTPDLLQVGKPYPGPLPDEDGAVFELSKYGPELRLFFAKIPDELAQCVERDDVYLGVLRHGDLGIVPWKIGDRLHGDAQFHVYLYPPETRPIDQLVSPHERYPIQITLVDRTSATVRALRHVSVSSELAADFDDIVNHQLGNQIGHADYDAQVSGYQTEFPDLETVFAAALRFEKAEG